MAVVWRCLTGRSNISVAAPLHAPWQDPGGNCSRRAAGGISRRIFEVPGIVTGAVEPRLGIRIHTEFRARAAADEHEAGLLAARHVGGLVIGDEILEQAAAEGRRLTGLEGAEILDKVGHALQRPIGKPRRDRLARLLVLLVHDGVYGWIDLEVEATRFWTWPARRGLEWACRPGVLRVGRDLPRPCTSRMVLLLKTIYCSWGYDAIPAGCFRQS